jgi:hypothetical protein
VETSHASTRTLRSSAQRELCKAVDKIADTLDGNQRDITAIREAGAYTTKMAATAERAASNMGQQLQDKGDPQIPVSLYCFY